MRKILFFLFHVIVVIVEYIRPRWDAVTGKFLLNKIKNKGVGCYIYGRGVILDPDKMTLGDGVQIGSNFYFAASGRIDIGDFSHISRNVAIYSRNHDYHSSALPYDGNFSYKPVKIGQCVWIGMNVNIVPGVTIGDGAIIGIGTTVSKNVPAGAIVVGQSSRIVGYRDAQHYSNLYAKGCFWGKNTIVIKESAENVATRKIKE